jgi:glycosyltransferase involved in cell wall biosynthesis
MGVNVRIIAVNDSKDVLRAKDLGLNGEDKLIQLLGRGYIAALATGISASTAEYIAFQDSDDFSDSQRLQRQLAHLQANSLDLVTAQLVRTTEEGNVWPAISPFGKLASSLTSTERLIFGPHGADSSILAKAAFVKATWPFHSQFSPTFADYGWLLHVAPKIKIGYSAESIYYYRSHADQMSRRAHDMSDWHLMSDLWIENLKNLSSNLTPKEISLLEKVKLQPKISLAISFPSSLTKLSNSEIGLMIRLITLIRKIVDKSEPRENKMIHETLKRRAFLATRGKKIQYWAAGSRLTFCVASRFLTGIKPRIGK